MSAVSLTHLATHSVDNIREMNEERFSGFKLQD